MLLFLVKLGDRLMVGHIPLEDIILVRVQVSQLCLKPVIVEGIWRMSPSLPALIQDIPPVLKCNYERRTK
jgi:hypothetical protein